MGNEREQFEKYRDDDIKGLTNYAREYGAVKALELAAQKTATLQLVIDRYRTGELRAELRPEPTAGDTEAAEKLVKKALEDDGELTIDALLIGEIADALSAARGNRAELEAAAREAREYLDRISDEGENSPTDTLFNHSRAHEAYCISEKIAAILGAGKDK